MSFIKVFSLTNDHLTLSLQKEVDKDLPSLSTLEKAGIEAKEEMEGDINWIKKTFPSITDFKFFLNDREEICFTVLPLRNKIYSMVSCTSKIRYFVGKDELKDYLTSELEYKQVDDLSI